MVLFVPKINFFAICTCSLVCYTSLRHAKRTKKEKSHLCVSRVQRFHILIIRLAHITRKGSQVYSGIGVGELLVEQNPLEERMALDDFVANLQTKCFAPYPVTPKPNETPLEAIFSWEPNIIDLPEYENENRKKLHITLCEIADNKSLTGTLKDSFQHQAQVFITEKTICEYVKEIYPNFFKKQQNRAKSEEKIEKIEKIVEMERNSSLPRTMFVGSVQHNILTETGSKDNIDCLIIPVNPLGAINLRNSPEIESILTK